MQQIVNELLSTAALCDARFFAHAEEKNDWSDFTALCIFYVSVNVKYVNGSAFLAAPHNLGLMMNVDWFSPFKHTPYSVGAVYLSVMNLPRSKRFVKENMILVGLIPGPNEPSLNINSYLEPLVEELKVLWSEGMVINMPDNPGQQVHLKAGLLCVACDIPAARKVCGFLGHMAKLGCSK